MAHELSVTRYIAAPRAIVWKALRDRQAEWWCPKPWTAEIVEQDLRPGGRSAMVMRGPNGESVAQEGVFLEIVDGERLVFTDAFATGWQPAGPFMVGLFELADEAGGTRYTARARHWTEQACAQHREMGFDAGWGVAADQLAALAEAMAHDAG